MYLMKNDADPIPFSETREAPEKYSKKENPTQKPKVELKAILPIFGLPDIASSTQQQHKTKHLSTTSLPGSEFKTKPSQESWSPWTIDKNTESAGTTRTIGEITFCSVKDTVTSSDFGLSAPPQSNTHDDGGLRLNQKQKYTSCDVNSDCSNDSDAMVIDLHGAETSPRMGPIKSPIKLPRKTVESGVINTNRTIVRKPKVRSNKEIGISLSSVGNGRDGGIGGTLEIRDPSNGTTVRITLHTRTPGTDTVTDSVEMSPIRVPVVPSLKHVKDQDIGTAIRALQFDSPNTKSSMEGKKERVRKQSTPRKYQKHPIGETMTNETVGNVGHKQGDLLTRMESGYESDTNCQPQDQGKIMLESLESQNDSKEFKSHCSTDLTMQHCHSNQSVNKQVREQDFKSDKVSESEHIVQSSYEGKPFICKFCSKHCDDKKAMYRHFRVCRVKQKLESKSQSQGPQIQASSERTTSLHGPIKSHHSKDVKVSVACPFCDMKRVMNTANYESHVKKHHMTECKVTESGQTLIPAGIQVTEAKESIICVHCDIKFAFRSEYENHLNKRHRLGSTNEKQDHKKVGQKKNVPQDLTLYMCRVCRTKIEGKKRFSEHVSSQCTHVSYVCRICGTQVFNLNKFVRHKKLCKERQQLEQGKLRKPASCDILSSHTKGEPSHAIATTKKSSNFSISHSTGAINSMTEASDHRDTNEKVPTFKRTLEKKREPIKIRKCQKCNVSCIGNKGLMLHLKSAHPS